MAPSKSSRGERGSRFQEDGFALQPGVFEGDDVEGLRNAVAERLAGSGDLERGSSLFGMRNVLDRLPEVASMLGVQELRDFVASHLGPEARVVRGLFFDKTPEANWRLGWHQDKMIAVEGRHDLEGWGPWSVKAGVPHVRPPREVLEQMLSLRLHLDDCGKANGALWVLPGSHREGWLDEKEMDRREAQGEAVVCEAAAGDVLWMRPLLAHRSGRSESPAHRRVLHLELAAEPLPAPVAWYWKLPVARVAEEEATGRPFRPRGAS